MAEDDGRRGGFVLTIPYMQKIVSDYLRSNATLTAVTNRIVSEPPDKTETPWVMVRQLDATDTGQIAAEHLINYLFQFDCYVGEGEGTPQVFSLGHKVRDALKAMQGTTQGGAVISKVLITGDRPLPDTDLAGRWRKVIDATIFAHG